MAPRSLATARALRRGALAACLVVLGTATVAATAIEVVVDDSTGEVFLKNPTGAAETIDGYALFSPSASFLPLAWTPVATDYDLSGDQSVDSVAEWFIIESAADSLVEVSTVEFSGSLDPGQVVSLGLIWSVGAPEALAATLTAGSPTTTPVVGDFRDLTADYDGDLDVDLDDLAVFAATLGSTVDLRADGNGDLVVDAADYTVWRQSDELVLGGSSSATPEPSTAALVCLAAASATAAGRR